MSESYELADALALHDENPRSFRLPAPREMAQLAPGRLAKLIFHPADGTPGMPERMWVEITATTDDGWEGTLANHPATLPLRHGDPVRFAARNVIATVKDYPA